MAAPAEITMKNLTGNFVMNKTLSDEFEPILSMQGVGWIHRKAIQMATITLHVKQYTDDAGKVHIDIEQTATGGFKGTSEHRVLAWEEAEHSDYIFGKVRGRSRLTDLKDVQDSFLSSNWLPENSEGDAKVVETNVTSLDKGWIANQIWGFQEVNGERRYCRHAQVTLGDEVKVARLVYDYVGPNDK